MINQEKQYYRIDPGYIVDKPLYNSYLDYQNHNNVPPSNPNPNYPAGAAPGQYATSQKMYSLNGSTNRTGLEMVLKVMAGDKVDIFGRSYHTNYSSVSNGNSTSLSLFQIMSGIISSPSNAIGVKGVTASQLESWNSSLLPGTFIRGQNYETGTTIPKAYINYIFLDEQFRYVSGGASRVGSAGAVKQHWSELSNIAAQKNGYLLVYVSNESNFTVFFDNLQVVHKPGPIVEETHYYPFGLVMNGISSKALNNAPVNKKKFNGIEHTTEFDLNTYDAFFRNVDPQIGRWWQIDPKPNEMQSLYSMIGNDPIRFADPLGDTLRFTSAQIQNQSTVNNVTADLQRATGLTLSIDANGNLTYATTTNSKGRQEATISKDANGKYSGSKSARKDLMKALNSRKTVDVFAQNNIGSKGGGLQVNIDAIQVNKFIAGTSSDLNNFTQGFGMTFLHELQHTDIFGGKSDPAKQIVNGQVGVPFGDIGGPETRMNKVRRELNQQGMNLGQRLSYGPLPMGTSGMVYLPFSNRSLKDINSGTIPTSMMISYIP